MKLFKTWRAPLMLMLCALVAVAANSARSASPPPTGEALSAQDVSGLDRRISLLEQRFYTIESSIRQLEHQSTLSQRSVAPARSNNELEINLLRAEVAALQRQLVEVGCGLVKLDERTTKTSDRERPKRADAPGSDPCRLNPETPLRLSTRPSRGFD